MASLDINKLIPDDIEKLDRDEGMMTFLDTTPSALTMNLEVLGIGVTDYGISYNPQVEQEKWIIEKNARNVHESNQKQGSVSQTAYKGDPIFEFIEQGRDQLNYKTHIVDVDIFAGEGGVYPAKMTDGLIAITQFMNENAIVEYDLYYNGDSINGSVTFDATTGKATFTPATSL
jgi:hypothetical protein